MEMTVSGRLRLQPVREEPPRKGSEWKKGRKEGRREGGSGLFSVVAAFDL